MPLIIEGDTEYSAFEALLNKYSDKFPLSNKPVLVRARGKFTLLLIMKILAEFKVSFGILHDADSPFRKDGKQNPAWKANEEISSLMEESRKRGIRVVHRISIPNFEWAHLPITTDKEGLLEDTDSKDKPWRAFVELRSNQNIENSILSVLSDFMNPEAQERPFQGDFMSGLMNQVQTWAKAVCPQDKRFFGG